MIYEEGSFDYYQAKFRNVITCCYDCITKRQVRGKIAERLMKMLLKNSFRLFILDNLTDEAIQGELLWAFYDVYKAYKPKHGTFEAYLLSCYHLRIYLRLARNLNALKTGKLEKRMSRLALQNGKARISRLDVSRTEDLKSGDFCRFHPSTDAYDLPVLNKMNEFNREILDSHYLNKMTYKELAEKHHKSTKTIQRSIHKSKQLILNDSVAQNLIKAWRRQEQLSRTL